MSMLSAEDALSTLLNQREDDVGKSCICILSKVSNERDVNKSMLVGIQTTDLRIKDVL